MRFLWRENVKSAGLFLAISSSVFISIEILVIDYLYRHNPSIGFFDLIIWAGIGNAVLGSVFFLSSRTSRKKLTQAFTEHKQLLIRDSLISVVAVMLYFIGIELIGSGSTSIFLRASLVFSVLFSVMLLKERVTKKELVLITLIITGFLIYQEEFAIDSLIGMLTILGATFLYALIAYLMKRENNGHNTLQYAYLRSVSILILNALLFMSFLHMFVEVHFIGWTNILILTFGVFCGGILARATAMASLSQIELHTFTIVRNSDMLFVIVGSYILFSDMYTPIKLFGVAVVMCAIALYALENRGKKKMKHHVPHPHHGGV